MTSYEFGDAASHWKVYSLLKQTVCKREEDFVGFEGPVEAWFPMTTEDILIVYPEDIHKVKVTDSESTLVEKACFKFKV